MNIELDKKRIILISPFSKPLRNFQQNAKNYPYMQQLISMLNKSGKIDEIWQIGVGNEYRFEGVIHKFDLPLTEIEKLARQVDLWISVDNFFPHLCNAQEVPTKGVVLFSKSDPNIFGYSQYTNILKDRKYLRPDQFNTWEECDFDANAYLPVEVVYEKVLEVLDK